MLFLLPFLCGGTALAESWVAAGSGGALGHPGERHGMNVGGLVPDPSSGVGGFSLLQPLPRDPTALDADIAIQAAGPIQIVPDADLAYVTVRMENAGPAQVTNAELTASVSPMPESITWLCVDSTRRCPAFGSGRTVSGIALEPGEPVEIEYSLQFTELSDFQVTLLAGSELDDPLALDNILTVTFSDLLFGTGFE